MKKKRIKIATDFSETPLGRFRTDSDVSGEAFREDVLVPSFKENDCVVVDIDGTEGYGSSFLEEAFGGLVRKNGFTEQGLRRCLEIERKPGKSKDYKALIWKYISDADKRRHP